MTTDAEIKTAIVNRMNRDDFIDVSNVMVEVDGGVVTLSGTVQTYEARNAAFDDARHTRGVGRVENRLDLAFLATLITPDDTEIAYNALRTLQWNANIVASSLEILVEAGLVTLKGTMPGAWQRSRAEDLVSDLRGVVGVTNELAVVPTQHVADELIARYLIEDMRQSVSIPDSDEIQVHVAESVVTLSGEVSSIIASRAAMHLAETTRGVGVVHDCMTPGPVESWNNGTG